MHLKWLTPFELMLALLSSKMLTLLRGWTLRNLVSEALEIKPLDLQSLARPLIAISSAELLL